MKYAFFVVLLVLVTFGVQAEVKTVPGPLKAWYADTMDMFTGLVTDLDKATTAKATASAFQKATAAIGAKKLAPRYQTIKKDYPDFFRQADSGNTTWVPPADWITLSQSYAKAMANYGTSMQKAGTFMSDPAVAQALQDFGQAMQDMQGSDD